jgi:hypothetical protein
MKTSANSNVVFSFERNKIYECGATLLAVLAIPEENSDERRLDLYRSLRGRALRLECDANPNDNAPITVNPLYALRDRQTIDRDVRYVKKRFSERMVAGRMAIGHLQTGRSLNALTEDVLEDAGQKDTTNVQRRFWAPSRPVIHLAAAAAFVGQIRSRAGYPLSLESLLTDRFLIETVVEKARRIEAIIAGNPKFPVRYEQLTQIRLG